MPTYSDNSSSLEESLSDTNSVSISFPSSQSSSSESYLTHSTSRGSSRESKSILTGYELTGSRSTGSSSTGSGSTGSWSTSTGSTSTGSTSIKLTGLNLSGSTSTGSTSTGSTSTGSTSIGSTSTGSTPIKLTGLNLSGSSSRESTSTGSTSRESTSTGSTSRESTSTGSTSRESTSTGSTSRESTPHKLLNKKSSRHSSPSSRSDSSYESDSSHHRRCDKNIYNITNVNPPVVCQQPIQPLYTEEELKTIALLKKTEDYLFNDSIRNPLDTISYCTPNIPKSDIQCEQEYLKHELATHFVVKPLSLNINDHTPAGPFLIQSDSVPVIDILNTPLVENTCGQYNNQQLIYPLLPPVGINPALYDSVPEPPQQKVYNKQCDSNRFTDITGKQNNVSTINPSPPNTTDVFDMASNTENKVAVTSNVVNVTNKTACKKTDSFKVILPSSPNDGAVVVVNNKTQRQFVVKPQDGNIKGIYGSSLVGANKSIKYIYVRTNGWSIMC